MAKALTLSREFPMMETFEEKKELTRRVWTRAALLAILLAAAVGALLWNGASHADRQAMELSIDRESVSYAVVYSRGLSPVTLSYSEHGGALNALFDMLSGSYEYVGDWRVPAADGGGPGTIGLYDRDGGLIDTIQFLNDQIYVRISGTLYYTYEPRNGTLDFTGFYAYLDGLQG